MSRHWRVLLVSWSAVGLSAPAAEISAQDVGTVSGPTVGAEDDQIRAIPQAPVAHPPIVRMRLGPAQPVAADIVQKVTYSKTTIAASLEVNPPGLPPGGSLDEPARSPYGPTRVGVLVEHEQWTSRRGFLAGSYRTGTTEFIDKACCFPPQDGRT
jgi:hypothetical protein